MNDFLLSSPLSTITTALDIKSKFPEIKFKTIYCKTALTTSKLFPDGYALNPYRGCIHGCLYCYAPMVIHELERVWGSFVDIKVNIATKLKFELERMKQTRRVVIGVGTVTDPYQQPIEQYYQLTRRCIELITAYDFPLVIQTKSDLVLRELELLKSSSECEVGITITTLNEYYRKLFEPRATPTRARLRTLKILAENRITTWVFIGPILPYAIDTPRKQLEALIQAIATAAPDTFIYIDRLRPKRHPWLQRLLEGIAKVDPGLERKYRELLRHNKQAYEAYFNETVAKLITFCEKYKLEYRFAFS